MASEHTVEAESAYPRRAEFTLRLGRKPRQRGNLMLDSTNQWGIPSIRGKACRGAATQVRLMVSAWYGARHLIGREY
jgi:hypothetical protein